MGEQPPWHRANRPLDAGLQPEEGVLPPAIVGAQQALGLAVVDVVVLPGEGQGRGGCLLVLS